jgi:dipeptidase D
MNPIELILTCFEQVSAIPRGTKNEAGIRAWLQEWAHERRLLTKVDATGNLVIQVPASQGYEDRPTLILQGHLDMVCQKTPDSRHDFTRDPIRLIREGDWLVADKTTLGADNGIAIALMMALVDDDTILHPALELLMTVEEEVGVTGADQIDPALLTGKTLINLDSEEEGVITIGCAGGGGLHITLPVSWEARSPTEATFELRIAGLMGGHSAEDINKHRGNANKLIARVLDYIQGRVPIRLASLKGGTARNAIPREAGALFTCPLDGVAACQEQFAQIQQTILDEHLHTEPGLYLNLTQKNIENLYALSRSETLTAIRLLISLPQGVSAMSAEIPGLIETSSNIGIVELQEIGLLIVSHQRSSLISRLEEITSRVEAMAWLAGARTERTKLFPPWQPNMSSALLKKCIEIYQAVHGKQPEVSIAHGGVECGVISERCGGLDTISLGPTIQNPHSPDERLFIPSLVATWTFLAALLIA